MIAPVPVHCFSITYIERFLVYCGMRFLNSSHVRGQGFQNLQVLNRQKEPAGKPVNCQKKTRIRRIVTYVDIKSSTVFPFSKTEAILKQQGDSVISD